MLNNVVLIGRLTKDPELRYSQSGTAVCSFTLAVDRPRVQGRDNEADFIPIVCFKGTAEAAANHLRKGHRTAVEGRIQTRHYENNEGRRINVTEIMASNVKFLESKQQTNDDGRVNSGERAMHDPFVGNGNPIDITDDDLPF